MNAPIGYIYIYIILNIFQEFLVLNGTTQLYLPLKL
jgi:hypothetical protein